MHDKRLDTVESAIVKDDMAKHDERIEANTLVGMQLQISVEGITDLLERQG
ncbi:unnamed protein product, partial [marine sediment metagenome]